MNIYVGNLSFNVTEAELQTLFGEHGKVTSINLIKDKYSGQSKGFGFVEMETQSEAEHAIKQLHGKSMGGRTLTVNAARPREDRSWNRSKRW